MTTEAVNSLHSINGAIQDVRSGYEALKDRAQPEILDTVHELDQMHAEHASQIQDLLTSISEDTDDGTIRGTVNKAANAVRDMFTDMSEDALSFIRQGEEMLLSNYDSALESWPAGQAPDAREVPVRQATEIRSRISNLPAN